MPAAEGEDSLLLTGSFDQSSQKIGAVLWYFFPLCIKISLIGA